MIDLIFYSVIIMLILNFDKKLNGESLINNIKNKFNFKKFIGYSFTFTFLLLLIYYILVKTGVIIINFNTKFNLKLISYIILSGLVSPFIEEYIFRFIPYKFFKNSDYKYGIIFLSILVFTFSHKGNMVEYAIILMSAIMLTFMMFKEGNVLYNFLSHGLYNTLMIISLLLYNVIGFIYVYLFLILLIIGVLMLVINIKKK